MATKTRSKKTPTRLIFFLSLCLLFCIMFCSCNVTRVITNESKYTTKGDTVIVITTKTVESYDATKKPNF